MFHVNWCGICKKTLPYFIKAGAEGHGLGLESFNASAYDKIQYGHYDATDDKKFAREFQIRGYPTILYFDKGAPINYENRREFRGARTVPGFHAYAQKMNRLPIVQPVADYGVWENSMREENFVSFVYVDGEGEASESKLPIGVEHFARSKRDLHLFYRATPGLVPGELREPGLYAVTAEHQSHQVEIRKFAPSQDAGYDLDLLENFYKEQKFPGIWRISDANFYEFTHSGAPTLSFVLDIRTAVST